MLKVRVLIVPIVLGVLMHQPGAAAAQETSKGYLEGVVGSAHTVDSDSAYAGLGAWRLNQHVHLFGEIGRMRNVIGDELNDRLAATGAGIRASNQTVFGTEFPVAFEARVPAWYGLGGVRVSGPAASKLSTYVEGGLGSARLDPQVHLTIGDDNLDDEAAAITGLGPNRQQLEFLAGAGAGMAFQVWQHIRVEGGYRYMRLFGDAKTNINRVHVAGGWTF